MVFESFEPGASSKHALRVCQMWTRLLLGQGDADDARDVRRGLMLYGPKTGCGKTHLACACANKLIQHGVLAVFMPTVLIPRNNQDDLLDLADVQITPVLVLDDLGAEKPTPRLLECLYTIVERRLWTKAPTVVTTNMRPEHIRRYGTGGEGEHGDKLYSRLMAMCECVPVDGPDRRLR